MRLWILLVIGLWLAAACVPPTMTSSELTARTPPMLLTNTAWSGPVRKATIRVWADDAYRSQNPFWERSVDDLVTHANELLIPQFGLELVPELRIWNRRAKRGIPLAKTMAELQREDPGDDVFAVVGMTSSLPRIVEMYEQVGVAARGGRHIVLRGHSDAVERRVFAMTLSTRIGDAERARLIRSRRRHRSAAVLLHELAHALGVSHDPVPGKLMAARYSQLATSFHQANRSLILTAIERRVNGHQQAAAIFDVGAAAAAGPLVIALTSDETYVVGGATLSTEDLEELLRRRVLVAPDSAVVIEADPRVAPELVSQLMNRVYAVGFAQVSVSIPEAP